MMDVKSTFMMPFMFYDSMIEILIQLYFLALRS